MYLPEGMRLAVLLSLAFVVGCGGKTPTGPGSAVLRFTQRTPSPGSPEVITVEAGRGAIAVRATFASPDPCRTLEGTLDRSGGSLALRVTIRPTGGVCVLVVDQAAYDASIEGLEPGRYSLQIVHTYPSTGWPTTVVWSDSLDVR